MALIYVILYDPLCAPCDSPGGGWQEDGQTPGLPSQSQELIMAAPGVSISISWPGGGPDSSPMPVAQRPSWQSLVFPEHSGQLHFIAAAGLHAGRQHQGKQHLGFSGSENSISDH